MLYFDTSALLPYYRHESASDSVQMLLDTQHSPVMISYLTEVEFASALARWVRIGEITEPHANRIEAAFSEDRLDGRFLLKPLTRQHFERATHWLLTRKTALRTLDALHLACAAGNEATLISLDDAMLATADFLGLSARKP
jgi:predicted nucleic acid-binding protein